jgi:pyruvate dehydrogenase complex dehydrogenase (E1) component
VDAETTVIATLYALYQKGALAAQAVDAAIKKLGINSDKSFPLYL